MIYGVRTPVYPTPKSGTEYGVDVAYVEAENEDEARQKAYEELKGQVFYRDHFTHEEWLAEYPWEALSIISENAGLAGIMKQIMEG